MAQIAVVPYVLKDVIFQVGTDTYEKHVSSVVLAPSTSLQQWKGLTPSAVFTDVTSPTWSCVIQYAQDWETANSLAQYLLTNQGLQKTVVFKPRGITTGKPIFTVDMIIVPGQVGGDVDTFQTATVTMGCVGAPVKTTAP